MNVNIVIAAGHLTRDPELRYTPSGVAVCNFGLAINRQWKGKDGEEKKEVCFIDCVAWQKRGEAIAEYLRKGAPIFVEGHLEFQQWEKDGERRSKHVVVVDRFEFVGAKSDRQEGPAPKSASEVPQAPGEDEDVPF